jgi:ribosomal protein S18 acetylase RimI-like enzyme
MISIRKAKSSDELNVRTLLKVLLAETLIDGLSVDESEAASQAYQALLTEQRGAILVAEDESGFLGCISFSYNLAIRYGGEYAQIEELIVNEKARGKSVGASLVQECIKTARNRGCREIGLYAMEHNVPFYEKQGFSYVAPELRLRLDE